MGMKAYVSIVCFFSCLLFSAKAQQEWDKISYAREIIDTLTSVNMHGRGYVNEGDQLAADYIKRTFQTHGLKSFTPDFYQSFHFSVNTFPENIEFSIMGKDGKTRQEKRFSGKPGINMLVGAGCPETKGVYPVVVFDSTFASAESFETFKPSQKIFILADDRGVTDKKKLEYFKKVKSGYFGTTGVIEFTGKLTHTVSQQVNPFCTVKVLSDSFNLDAKRLKKLRVALQVENKFITDHLAKNVIGYVKGKVHPDSFLVFSAHYDHLGQLGKDVYFPGSNDNASGCAMLLNLARYYSMPAHQQDYSIVFMAFAGEEMGLLGSDYYTDHPLFPLNQICFLLNMDIMGTGDEGITVENGTLFKPEFDKLVEINTENNFLKEIKRRGKAANSDHYPFSEKGVKAFFIYTLGGIKAYHDVYDKAETLPLTKFEELFKLITRFADYLQHH